MMNKMFCSTLFLLTISFAVHAQGRVFDQPNQEGIYTPNIKSVKFYVDGIFLSLPIVSLNSGTQLILEFDDLEGGVKDFYYSVYLCDKDWNLSSLSDMEYIDGFTEELIRDYAFSFKSMTNYTHYSLAIPNADMRWTKSGNYVIQVYDRDRDMELVLSRRFIVSESKVGIDPRLVKPSVVSKSRTHQEIDFDVDLRQMNVRNPRMEISASILQNGRWDNAVLNIAPMFVKGEILSFDHRDKIVFQGGKEFRDLDLRSLRLRDDKISLIERDQEGFRAVMFKEHKRSNQLALSFNDLNGNFIIEDQDKRGDSQLTGDYVDILFALDLPPTLDKDIYLMGAFTDWKLDEQYRMVYNQAVNAYVGTTKLKQGYYDYNFVTTPAGEKNQVPSFEDIEGNSFDTENKYTIIIYYRGFGDRYDRILGVATFQAN